MKASEILSESAHKEIFEHASGGASGAGNVATSIGGIGAGFDPDGHKGIYDSAEKKKAKKATILRR